MDDLHRVEELEQEVIRLRGELEEQARDISRLIQWVQALQQDVMAVYSSVTWRVGSLVTRWVLWVLRRSPGPTAWDHIVKTLKAFEGWRVRFFQARRSLGEPVYRPWHEQEEYALWIKQYDVLTAVIREEMVDQVKQWVSKPMVSLFLLPGGSLEETLRSVHAQIYPDWEVLLVGQGGGNEAGVRWVSSLGEALGEARGEFIAVIKAGSRLAPHALFKMVEAVNVRGGDVLYSDEDRLDGEGQRWDPYFKGDWNPDLFYAQHFLGYLTFLRRALVVEVGGFNSEDYAGEEGYDVILRLLERGVQVEHVPHVLYHQGERKEPLGVMEMRVQALEAHFRRLRQEGIRVMEEVGGHTRIVYPVPTPVPLVSVIIPTRDRVELLREAVSGVLEGTDYPRVEVIIVDNGSVEPTTLEYLAQVRKEERVRVVQQGGAFNYSRLNNLGVRETKGEVLALLNNDVKVFDPGWLQEMVSQAWRPEVGAVGAKLFYANDTLQHAGVVVGLGGMAGHGLKYLAKEAPGYQWRPFLVQNCSAVTGACLVMRRSVFEEVGGFEERLKVAFNDVDLCLRVREQGYRIVWTPYAQLYHLESASRGLDNNMKKFWRLQGELKYMKSRWGKVLESDPFYSPNLTIEYEDFSLAFPPRTFLV